MIEAVMENSQAADRVVPVRVVPVLVLADQKKMTKDFSDPAPAKMTSLARIVPRAVLEEDQVRERAARGRGAPAITEMTTTALPVAADLELESAVAVEDDNRTIFKTICEREHQRVRSIILLSFSSVFSSLFSVIIKKIRHSTTRRTEGSLSFVGFALLCLT